MYDGHCVRVTHMYTSCCNFNTFPILIDDNGLSFDILHSIIHNDATEI